MLTCNDLAKTAGAIRSASALTETTFLRVGQTLEQSIGILASLTNSFEVALTGLRGESLAGSLKALAGASASVAELGRGQPKTSAQFDHLQHASEAIAGRIAKMNRSVKAVDSLMISARIAAAAIRSSEIDFTTFASDIARTTHMAHTTLDHFGSELHGLRHRVGIAHATQLPFEQRQEEAIRSIPARLNATISSIPQQHRRAAQAISALRQRSEHVHRQTCAAVTALQAGDIARQRLEHIDTALGLLAGTQQPSAGAQINAASNGADFTEHDQRAFSMITCRLQSAQLSDTAAAFERDVRQITGSLHGLAAEARTLRTLAASAYGGSGRDQGTFMDALEAQVGETLALFADFGTSQEEAVRVMASVSNAAESLCGHLRTVQSLEADIRIMGLNTTLKCARVGPQGRALGYIAQELRVYGNEFAKEADALMIDVGTLAETTRSIGSSEADSAPLIAAVMQAMKDALATLRQVGQTLGDTVSSLERDSDRVVLMLDQTATGLGGHDEIGTALHQAISALQEISPPGDLPLTDLAPCVEQMLDLMARGYTMEDERVVHARILGRSAAAAKPAAQVELEDMLF